MSQAEATVLIGLLSAVLGGFVSWWTARLNRKSTQEHNILTGDDNLITQYRGLLQELRAERQAALEQATETRAERANALGQVDTLRERIETLEQTAKTRDRQLREYVATLHRHIYQQLPPPPPAWPDGLAD